ncbi:MAG: hypothetical protein AB7V18_20645, partial [Pyrinomonadaceae bacterium]
LIFRWTGTFKRAVSGLTNSRLRDADCAKRARRKRADDCHFEGQFSGTLKTEKAHARKSAHLAA